jgi:hypothetical protein
VNSIRENPRTSNFLFFIVILERLHIPYCGENAVKMWVKSVDFEESVGVFALCPKSALVSSVCISGVELLTSWREVHFKKLRNAELVRKNPRLL